MRSIVDRSLVFLVVLLATLRFSVSSTSAQCGYDFSDYAAGYVLDYNTDGEAPLVYYSSGYEQSTCPGYCYHVYDSSASVDDGSSTLETAYGETFASGIAVLPPGAYNVSGAFTVWCSCINTYVGTMTALAQTTVPPRIPTGETSSADGWEDGGRHRWLQTLLPQSVNFYGRWVKEFQGSGPADSCWFANNSANLQPFGLTGGEWQVAGSNLWGMDYVGYYEDVITYWRAQGRAPCGVWNMQDMKMNVSGIGWVTYHSHSIGASIDATEVTSFRNGQTVTHAWP